jgi:hypothetical protein
MKTTLLLCALFAHTLAAKPVLCRITPEALASLQQKDPMIRLAKPADDQAGTVGTEPQSIIKQSTILNDGKNWTMVPNGAVVHLPPALKQRVNTPPAGTLLPWLEFLTLNRSWISTSEVTFDQAAGSQALPEERTSFWTKQNSLIIAVHQNGPISVLIPKSTPNTSNP